MENGAVGTAAILAIMLMPLVSLLKKPTWSRQAKYLLGMAAALVCAIAGAFVDGHVKSAGEFVAYLGVSLATSQTIYNLYFKDTEVQQELAAK